ncbi:MAG TPA: hypothetical protein VFX12_07750 [Vicinamibacterales bacterium]|nr:hypothetical protein [Vicinamibacterales bacterium]
MGSDPSITWRTSFTTACRRRCCPAIAVSIVLHGITVSPLMAWYGRHPDASTPLTA